MKNEDLLQYIWQYQLFDKNQLVTDEGLSLQILKPGISNSDSGPDFDQARIVIDSIEWAGKVEIHINASDWYKHKHNADPVYDAVILHVVWINDKKILRLNGSQVQTLSLKEKIDPELLKKYLFLKENQQQIPCEIFYPLQPELKKLSMLEKALANRMERKAAEVLQMYRDLNNDFEEVAYRLLLRNFGFKLNSDSFLRLAGSIPFKILAKYRSNLFQIEALLFGQAGFLDSPENDQAEKLQKEYSFLSKKYNLNGLNRSDWRFLRTRPQNFPTVRLAQLAALLTKPNGIFSVFIETDSVENIISYLNVSVSEYWQNHYDWNKRSNKVNKLGKESVENILINTVAPLLASYYYLTDDYKYFERSLRILEKLNAERNFITRVWESVGQKCQTAFDSQALIEQYNEYCTKRRCLNCPVGIETLRS